MFISTLLVVSNILVHAKEPFPMTTNLSTMLIDPSGWRKETVTNTFILDCIKYWKLKQPKIFIRKEMRGTYMLKQLSKVGSQPLVRNNIDIDQLEDIVFANSFTHIVVADNRETILRTIKKLSKMRVLDKNGMLILICIDCKNRYEFINGTDSITTILVCHPKINYDEVTFRIRKLHYSYVDEGFTSKIIGKWNEHFGFYIRKSATRLQDKSFFNLEGRTLNILAAKTILFVGNDTRTRNDKPIGGMLGDLLELTSEVMNFTYKLGFSERSYGNYGRSSLDEVINEFVNSKSDVGLGIFSRLASRVKLVEFTSTFFRDEISFRMKASSKINAATWMLCLKSFSFNFWMAILVLTASVGFALIAVSKKGSPKKREKVEYAPLFMSIISLQGAENSTNSLSSKIIILTAYLFYWMTFAIYNGILVSFLTLDISQKITTLDDLIHSDYNIYVTKIGHDLAMLKLSGNPNKESIQKRIILGESIEVVVNELCTFPKYTYAFDKAIMNYILKDYPTCEVYALKEIFYYDYYHLITRKNTVLHIRISKVFDKMKEVGIMKRMEYKNDVTKYMTSKRPESENWVPIHLHHVLLPLGIISCGSILAILALAFEIINHRLHKMNIE